ncbi:MAG: hypothetical protein HYZ49_06360 [Chloroflexi bacterium]|nr:hypothetical protein [Chloroflexota bacterium]
MAQILALRAGVISDGQPSNPPTVFGSTLRPVLPGSRPGKIEGTQRAKVVGGLESATLSACLIARILGMNGFDPPTLRV